MRAFITLGIRFISDAMKNRREKPAMSRIIPPERI